MDIPPNTVSPAAETAVGRRRSGSETRLRRRCLGVRLTAAERERLDALAAAAGVATADYLRRVGLGRRFPPMSAASPGTDALRAIAGAVAGIGGNLNRIARVADAALIKGEPPAPQLGALAEAAAALDRIGAALRRALAVEGVGEPP